MSFEPVRLIEQTDVSDVERSLLRAGRAGAPVEYDVAAGAARLRAQLATLGAAGAVATAAGAASRPGVSAGAKALFAKVAFKIFLGLVAGAAFAGAGVVAGVHLAKTTAHVVSAPLPPKVDGAPVRPLVTVAPSDVPTTEPPSIASAVGPPHDPTRPVAEPVRPAPTRLPSRSAVAPTHPPSASGSPNERREVVDDAVAVAAPSAAAGVTDARTALPATPPEPTPAVEPASPPAPPPSESLSEIRAVALARALVERDPNAAISLLEKAQRTYPGGYFVEERQALIVLALSRSGNTASARQHAAAFLRTYPNGPFSDRVRAVAAP